MLVVEMLVLKMLVLTSARLDSRLLRVLFAGLTTAPSAIGSEAKSSTLLCVVGGVNEPVVASLGATGGNGFAGLGGGIAPPAKMEPVSRLDRGGEGSTGGEAGGWWYSVNSPAPIFTAFGIGSKAGLKGCSSSSSPCFSG